MWGNSGAQFMVVGVCVRAAPVHFFIVELKIERVVQMCESAARRMLCLCVDICGLSLHYFVTIRVLKLLL